MSDETPEAIPEPTEIETVARLAAEAATRALPDNAPRLAAVEETLRQILAALAAAAGPEGNAAQLGARLAAVELTLAGLTSHQPAPHPEQQKLIDDLRLKVANLEHTIKTPRKDTP